MENADQTQGTDQVKKLKQLCVISFINIGIFIVVYGFGLLSMMGIQQMTFEVFEDSIRPQLELFGQGEEIPGLDMMLHLIHESGSMLLGIFLARTIVRGIGVYLMYNGKPGGFPIYAGAQLIGIFAPHIVLPWAFLGVFGPIASVAMTALYGARVKAANLADNIS